MSKEVYVNANLRFKARSDTKENWQLSNPILLAGEAGVVTNGTETEKIKFGDGVTPWNELGFWKGPKGDNYILTDSDKQEIAEILKPKRVTFSDGEVITVQNNVEYVAYGAINSLTVIYPETDFICSFGFTLASEGDITVILPESKYIGSIPSFANGETWELNIRNGVVVGGLAE